MLLHFFMIPVGSAKESEADLNQFISQNRIVNIEKHFVADGSNSFWSVCVTTAPSQTALRTHNSSIRRSTVDYKQILSPEDFAVFAELRKLRKQIAEAEGIPAYAVFTNEQLAGIVKNKVRSNTGLAAIEGVGQVRVDKHAQRFLSCLIQYQSDNVLKKDGDQA